MRGSFRLHLILLLATAFAAPTPADTDPTLSQVYEAARTGHLEQVQTMIKLPAAMSGLEIRAVRIDGGHHADADAALRPSRSCRGANTVPAVKPSR
jgi:hypothetical protein